MKGPSNPALKDILEVLNNSGIFPKVYDDSCVLKTLGRTDLPCPTEYPSNNDCGFFCVMCADFMGAQLGEVNFPEGFSAHILNSIALHKAGIKVELAEVRKF